MARLDHLRRVNYGPNAGRYEGYEGWTEQFYVVVKDTETGKWVMNIHAGRGDSAPLVGTRITDTLAAQDRYIDSLAKPHRDKARAEREDEQRRRAQENADRAARAKAERLSVNSHLDSDVWIKAKITRDEAVRLAAGLLYWADGGLSTDEGIDLNIQFNDASRQGNWVTAADDARMELSVGWSGRGEVSPLIVDSYIAKREQPEPVEVDDNIGVAV